jgi:hypothetical protein
LNERKKENIEEKEKKTTINQFFDVIWMFSILKKRAI